MSLWVVGVAFGQKPLTRINDIRNLSPERAAENLPVMVEGQVTHVRQAGSGFFIYDGKKGIFVVPQKPGGKFIPVEVEVGERLRVSGYSVKGNFYPAIGLDSLERIGKAPLPDARLFYLHELYYPSIDSDWVKVRGRLISMAIVEGHEEIVLGVDMSGIEVTAHLAYTEANYKRLSELMFRLVGFNAVAGTIYNNERQLTDRIFFASSAEDFELLLNYDVPIEEVPFYETHELMRVGSRLREMISTRGVVTHAVRNQLYIRGPVSSLLAVTREPLDFKVGDLVTLQGFALAQPVSPAMQAINVAFIDSEPEPAPLTVLLGETIDPGLNFELISLEARLVDIGKTFDLDPLSIDSQERASLLCRSGPHIFEAYLPSNVSVTDLRPGARLRLTGICQLNVDPRARWALYIDGLSLQLRSMEDIQVIAAAPFWTTARFLSALAVLAAILVLFLVWVILLRRRVEKQTAVIGKQVERQTISDERQRIARELHDNLEQGLAGMAIQLRGVLKLQKRFAENAEASIRKALQLSGEPLKQHLEERVTVIEENAEKSQRALSTVQDMLVYCSEESRASILDLRGGLLERMDLHSALQVALEPLAETAAVGLEVTAEGPLPRMRHQAERNLFLIVREAVSNALRHAEPEHVRVHLQGEGHALQITVIDDGKGFDVDHSARPGHFGLVGMQERASHLHAKVTLESKLGEGTTVKVVLEDMREWEKQ